MEKTFLSEEEIKKAKKIPISEILRALGCNCEFKKQVKKGELWCTSPFRPEREASFKINLVLNTWVDFGLAEQKKGGNVFDLIMRLTNATLAEAFAILKNKNLDRFACPFPDPELPEVFKSESGLVLKKVIPLQHRALKQYLASRKISLKIAESYLEELHYTRKEKPYFALAFPSDSGGYELRNPYFQGFLGESAKKDVSFISVGDKPSGGLHIFEGFMDFLSSIEHFRRYPKNDVVVLNSVSLVTRIKGLIGKYKAIYCFLDNDDAGKATLEKVKQMASDKEVVDRSYLYGGFKDFNEYLVNRERDLER